MSTTASRSILSPVRRAFLELHLAVLLYGFTAILGDLISLPATTLVWWRVLLASMSLFFLIKMGRHLKEIPAPLIRMYVFIGILVAIHWITFFGSIKYANASIALVCMATGSFFTAILEPLMTKQPFRWHEIGLGLLIIPGMVLVVQSLEVEMLTGVWLGIISALLAVIFTILNKKNIHHAPPLTITFLEMSSACLFITLLLPYYLTQVPEVHFWPVGADWFYLLVLAVGCTTFAYALNLRALQHLSAFAANLTINLEPVYGIFLAVVILKENRELSPDFYAGVVLILGIVFCYPLIKRRLER